MLEENFPRQIFLLLFLAWLPKEMKLACITLSLYHDCSASTKLNSIVIFKIVRSCNRPVQHSALHGRQLPKSLILLPAEEKSGWLGWAGSSCWPCWTSTGWPPCMHASPEHHLLGHSPSSGQATVAKIHGRNYTQHCGREAKGRWGILPCGHRKFGRYHSREHCSMTNMSVSHLKKYDTRANQSSLVPVFQGMICICCCFRLISLSPSLSNFPARLTFACSSCIRTPTQAQISTGMYLVTC